MKHWRTTIALGATVLAWLFAAIITLVQWRSIRDNQCLFLNNWPGCAQVPHVWQALVVGIIMSLLAIGGYGLWRTWSKSESEVRPRWIIGLCLVIALAGSFLVAPFTSGDVQFYFSVGRSVAVGQNPYAEPWLRTIPLVEPAQISTEQGVMYGPLMVRLFANFYNWSNGQLLLFIVYWKILMLVVWAAVTVAVWALARSLSVQSSPQKMSLFWLAQPLVLWEWIGNGHFDGLWVLTIVGAFAAAQKKRWGLVAAFLAMGVWLKFIPILLVPWFALWWWSGVTRSHWQRGAGQAIRAIVITSVVTWVSWFGLWAGPGVFAGLVRQSKWAVSSLFSTVYYTVFPIVQPWLGGKAHLLVTSVVQGGLLVLALYLLYPYLRAAWQLVHQKQQWQLLDYIQAVYVTLLVYLLVWQKSFWPWYFAWLIPFGLILTMCKPVSLNRTLLGALSFAGLLFYVPQQWNGGGVDILPMAYFVTLGIIVPPLYWVWQWRQKKYDLV